MRSTPLRVIGLDIGGSKTQAFAGPVDVGSPHREILAGSANLSSVGVEESARQLTAVFDQLGRDGIAAVCAGAAGVETPEQAARLHGLIAAQVPAAAIRIVHDSQLILAAADVDSGIALISGTGSVAWGRAADGTMARAGGWGYLLGDEGGGYWIGRQAVRHALALADRGEQADLLARQLADECGVQAPEQLLDLFYANPERKFWAGFSRLVFDCAESGHLAAGGIVAEAAGSLAALVRTVAGRLDITGPIVLGGGLILNQPLLRSLLTSNLLDSGHADIRQLRHAPAHGALTLARRLLTAPMGS